MEATSFINDAWSEFKKKKKILIHLCVLTLWYGIDDCTFYTHYNGEMQSYIPEKFDE